MGPEKVKEVYRLRNLFPSELKISVNRLENGEFLATINTFKGLQTEGTTFSELIEMVNDAVKTYFEVPEEFVPFMPNYIPPLEAAQKLDVFPIVQNQTNVIFPLSTSEKVPC